jgi:hypothetical protein
LKKYISSSDGSELSRNTTETQTIHNSTDHKPISDNHNSGPMKTSDKTSSGNTPSTMQNHSCSSSLWSQSSTHSQMPTESSLQPKDSVSHMYGPHPCQHEQFHTTSINRTFPPCAIV